MYDVLTLIGYVLLLGFGAWLLADMIAEWFRERINYE